MTPKPGLSDYVAAEATPQEIARQWTAIETRLHRRRRSRALPLALALGATAAAAIVYLSTNRAAAPRHWTSQGEPRPLALADGSQMRLAPRSEVSLADERAGLVRWQVLRGAARFEVRPDAARRFYVAAAGIEVLVTGTAFTVELAGGAPRVSVERGEVEVHPRHEARLLARLRAGESWPPRLAPAEAAAPPPPSESPAPARAEPVAAPSAPSTSSPRPAPVDARRLLEQANAARRSGDFAQAAALFESLGARYPRDPRAALAAFELGRLRLDALGDLPGAVQALKQSIALAPQGVFREDAQACLATAFARLRDHSRCESARRAYLERYPEGMHAAAVSALDCGAGL